MPVVAVQVPMGCQLLQILGPSAEMNKQSSKRATSKISKTKVYQKSAPGLSLMQLQPAAMKKQIIRGWGKNQHCQTQNKQVPVVAVQVPMGCQLLQPSAEIQRDSSRRKNGKESAAK